MTAVFSILFVTFLLFIGDNAWTAEPKITVIGQQTVDFGTYRANQTKQAVFTLKNCGNAKLLIKRIRKTCGCSATILEKNSLQAGEQTTLTVKIKKNSLEGAYSKAIYVESNSVGQRFLKLTLTGKALPILELFPKKNLYMGTLKAGNSYDYSFKIKPTLQPIKLKIKVLKNNFPVTAELRQINDTFILKITASPILNNNFIYAVIELNIISPLGWAPIKINLRGQSIR